MKGKDFKHHLYSEWLKMIYSKATRIALVFILVIQPMLAFIIAKQFLEIGLDATPETVALLAEAVPPLEYIGFDAITMGLLAMILLGASLGSFEYKKNTLRTSLLFHSDKRSFFLTKIMVTAVVVFVLSFVSIFISIACSQYALGESGLNPLLLNEKVWLFILLGTIAWTLVTLLSFAISYLFRSSVVALLFLIPQIYNTGNFLADKIAIAKLLPVSLAYDLIATSPERLTTNPLESIFWLSVWVVVLALLAYYQFVKTDIGSMEQ